MSDFIKPNKNDIKLGRGGNNNKHSGNEQLRQLARTACEKYVTASKREKSAISRQLVDVVHNMSPAGRFISFDRNTKQWKEVTDVVAREKTGQVLRDAMRALGMAPGTPNFEEPVPDAAPMTMPAQPPSWETSPVHSLPTKPIVSRAAALSSPWVEVSPNYLSQHGRTAMRTNKPSIMNDGSPARRNVGTPLPPLPVVPSSPPRFLDRKRSRQDLFSEFDSPSMLYSPEMPAPKRRMARFVPLPTPPPVPGPFLRSSPSSSPKRASYAGTAVAVSSPGGRARFYYSPLSLRRTPGSARFSSVSDRAGLFERVDDFQPVGLWQEFDLMFADDSSAILRPPSKDEKDNTHSDMPVLDRKDESSHVSFPSLVTF